MSDVKIFKNKLFDAPPMSASETRGQAIETQEKIASLYKKRVENLTEEFRRLNKNPRIRDSLARIVRLDPRLSRDCQTIIARTIELQETLQETHYVINHGQRDVGFLVNITAKKVNELFQSKKYIYFDPLRHEMFYSGKEDRGPDWYKRTLGSGSEIDHYYRGELICGDINLTHVENGESAIVFFSENRNVYFDVDNFISGILEKFFSKNIAIETAKAIVGLLSDLHGGVLYSICIPKSIFFDVAYMSKPYGRPVSDPQYSSADLDHLQQGVSDENSSQVRLIASRLQPEHDIYILPHSVVSQAVLEKIESAVERILLSAKERENTSYRFLNLQSIFPYFAAAS